MNLIQKSILTVIALTCLACSSATEESTGTNTSTDPNITSITSNVATNTGGPAQVVTDDVLEFSNTIRGNVGDYVSEVVDNSPGAGGGELAIVDLAISTDQPIVETIDISTGEESCDEGGTKTITGSVVVTVDSIRTTGTVAGSFDIEYDGCLDLAFVSYATGSCFTSSSLTGTVSTTIDIDYRTVSFQGQSEIRDETVTDTTSPSAFSVNVGSTNSSQTYEFEYDLSSLTSPSLSGTLSFNSSLYNITDLNNFLGNTTESVACPD